MSEQIHTEPVLMAEFDPQVDAVIITPQSLQRAKKLEIWAAIESEMKSAKKKYPSWPDHPAAQAGIVSKQSGDIMKAAINLKYRRGNSVESNHLELRQSAIKTIVAAFRLLENL